MPALLENAIFRANEHMQEKIRHHREGNRKGLPLRKLTCHFRALTINEKHQELFIYEDNKSFIERIQGIKNQPQP